MHDLGRARLPTLADRCEARDSSSSRTASRTSTSASSAKARGLWNWLRGRKETEGIEWTRPASGLVTALDPVMRACGGTWIAHGSGSADRETADAHGRVRVPPDRPSYTLRRVWLTPEEEQGYYYGCANNALWPLCHIAYARPEFDDARLAAVRAASTAASPMR